MKIVRVEAIPFAVPDAKPLKFAGGEVRTPGHVLIRVHTGEGLVGTTEAPPRPYTYGETQESIAAVVEKIFAPQILGLTAVERAAVHERLDRTVGNPTAMEEPGAVGRELAGFLATAAHCGVSVARPGR